MSFNYMEEIGTPANPDGVNQLAIFFYLIFFLKNFLLTEDN